MLNSIEIYHFDFVDQNQNHIDFDFAQLSKKMFFYHFITKSFYKMLQKSVFFCFFGRVGGNRNTVLCSFLVHFV